MLSNKRIVLVTLPVLVVVLLAVSFVVVYSPPKVSQTSSISTSSSTTLTSSTTLAVSTTTVLASSSQPLQNASSSVSVEKTGPLGRVLSVTAPSIASSGSAGNNTLRLDFSMILVTLGDDKIVLSNATASRVNVSVPTAGYQLVSVKIANLVNENPVTIQALTLMDITLIVKAPNSSPGAFVVLLDAENAA
jgi:hypothetical protein